ncbi:MAG: hypothetical protein BYD32DRAFT_462827 [Podila humilis]|nr:MAG: hypothetical protein BYD32DRAFT_462827 [Podila humilis]
MPPSSPINLPDICNLIAEHLPREAILMCCSVSRDWHSTFLPHLWRSVVFNGAGPIFSDSGTDPCIAHTHHLKYTYSASSFPASMPTQGYTHLTMFVIDQGGYEGGCDGPWSLLAAIMRTLANGLLSTLEMFPFEASSPFWKVYLSVEILKMLISKSMGCWRTLKYCDSVTSIRGNEFYQMVVDIKAAIAAAAEGRNTVN